MGNEHDAGSTTDFDWVNAWAAQSKPDAVAVVPPAAPAAAPLNTVAPARFVVPVPDDQLVRDIAEIERVRDRLAALPVPMHRTRALTLAAARTTDPVPVVIGGVLALVMLTVFGAAAAMSKLSR
jgi:hypothetical protein